MNSHKNLFAFDDGSFQKGKGKEACQGCYVAIPSQCFILVVYDAMETSIFFSNATCTTCHSRTSRAFFEHYVLFRFSLPRCYFEIDACFKWVLRG